MVRVYLHTSGSHPPRLYGATGGGSGERTHCSRPHVLPHGKRPTARRFAAPESGAVAKPPGQAILRVAKLPATIPAKKDGLLSLPVPASGAHCVPGGPTGPA